ncbi:MAG: hypothetical protein LBV28_00660 [Puniceicoccales bacterium]|nr:hypothetical protein [Puniceicoccales bacterium]
MKNRIAPLLLAAAALAPSLPAQTAQPLTLARAGNSYLNLSLVGDIAAGASGAADVGTLQTGGHDPAQRGFTIQGLEAIFEGSVDNYFRATANIVYGLDTDGESYFELEEAYAETLALPHGLQLRAGQYFTEFGRINAQHPHAWDFVDAPLATARFFGPDGLRNTGARLSWLAPTPFYSELFLGVQNSQGETAHSFRSDHEDEPYAGRPAAETTVHGFQDMLYTARYAVSVDLTDTQTLLGGVSAAWGPNSTGGDARTQIYGADFFWKWKPADHNKGFPFISVQSEILLRGFRAAAADIVLADGTGAALPTETFWDWGAYAQLSYGFREGWVASLRADYAAPFARADYEEILDGTDSNRARRWRISPALTWYPSEFSRIRIQYNYDHGSAFGDEHGVWVQLEFLLGSHAAHKF